MTNNHRTWWCEHAWLADGTVAEAVAITITDGVISRELATDRRAGCAAW
jgi:hypothetical protein